MMRQYRTLNDEASSTLNEQVFSILNMNLLSDRLAHIYTECPNLEGERGQIGLVKASGASRAMVNQWLSDKIKSIGIRYALNIERNLGYSHIWLMTGDGDPKTGAVLATSEERFELMWVSPRDQRLLTLFHETDEREQNDALRMLEVLVNMSKSAAFEQQESPDDRERRLRTVNSKTHQLGAVQSGPELKRKS
jgi:transcriptional regulator with XRE-family HTH domain